MSDTFRFPAGFKFRRIFRILRWNAEQRHNLFLAFKEALQNTVKHSGASTLHLGVTLESETLRVTLEDDGRGFLEGKAATGADGLRNMRERLLQLAANAKSRAPLNPARASFSSFP